MAHQVTRDDDPAPPLLGPPAAARRLGVSERTLAAWRRRGGGPPALWITARVIRYRADDLDRWLGAHAARR